MKKIIEFIVAVVTIVMLLTACSGTQTTGTVPEGTNSNKETVSERKVLGFLPSAMTSNFFIYTSEGAKAVAEANGYELLIQSPPSEDDFASAVSIMEDMITQGVDGIMLCTNSQESLAPAIKKANDAGIPVVMFNTTTEFDPTYGVDIYAYCGYDQYAGCGMIADWLNEYVKGEEAEVCIVEGLPSYYTVERAGGFKDRIEESYPNLKVVISEAGDWETEKAMDATMDMVQAHPSIKVVFTCSDPMAQGAWAACEQLNRKDLIVTGVDGNPDVLTSIRDGKITATLNANPINMGANAANALLDAIHGVERTDKVILSDINVVDPSNVAELLDKYGIE